MEAGDDIELDLRPTLTERIHGRHQPVEAGVALDDDPQLPSVRRRQPRHVALGLLHQRQCRIGQLQQAQAGGAELRRQRLALEQLGAEMVFQQLDLVRERRLRQIEQLRGAHQAAGVTQRDDGAQVSQFEDGLHHERNSS